MHIVSTLRVVSDSDESKHYFGTLDLARVRKLATKELDLTLIPLSSLPKSLSSLAKGSENDLVLFAAPREDSAKKG